MSLKTVDMVEIVCDGCGDEYCTHLEFAGVQRSEVTLWLDESCEWWVYAEDQSLHLCADCRLTLEALCAQLNGEY